MWSASSARLNKTGHTLFHSSFQDKQKAKVGCTFRLHCPLSHQHLSRESSLFSKVTCGWDYPASSADEPKWGQTTHTNLYTNNSHHYTKPPRCQPSKMQWGLTTTSREPHRCLLRTTLTHIEKASLLRSWRDGGWCYWGPVAGWFIAMSPAVCRITLTRAKLRPTGYFYQGQLHPLLRDFTALSAAGGEGEKPGNNSKMWAFNNKTDLNTWGEATIKANWSREKHSRATTVIKNQEAPSLPAAAAVLQVFHFHETLNTMALSLYNRDKPSNSS